MASFQLDISATDGRPAQVLQLMFLRLALKSLAITERSAIPFVDPKDVRWAIPSPDDELPRSSGVEGSIAGVFDDLRSLQASLRGASGPQAEMKANLEALQQKLQDFDPSTLAFVARHWHARACSVAEEVSKQLAVLAEPAQLYDPGSERRALQTDIQPSLEQQAVVSCSRSVFVQGRSGTGKTLVLVRRMLLPERQQSRQLFVAKSSLLLDKVVEDLRAGGCDLSRTTCRTWSDLSATSGTHLLNYQGFLRCYWPDLKKRITGDLPAHLVWAEFCTKLRPFRSFGKKLGLEDYMKDGISAVGVPLSPMDQQELYKVFVEYTRMKQHRNQLDDVDWAAQCDLQCCSPDFLYIDEAQDFSPWELTVLLRFCKRPDGVTVVGDTCQTINPGSAFNFDDIVEASGRRNCCELLNLRCNYRCAPGIASLSNTVMKLLLRRFPSSADVIEEVTVMSREDVPPLLIESRGSSAADIIMGTGSLRSDAIDPLRAAVLVRTEAARASLRNAGMRGVILTVAEAKGLEFQWVILYNMLTDGEAFFKKTLWKLADEDSQESKLVGRVTALNTRRRGGSQERSYADQSKLSSLAQLVPELKTLYVAITRGQVGCALIESNKNPDVWAPLRQLWTSAGAVECCSSLQEYAARLERLASTEARDGTGSGRADRPSDTDNDSDWPPVLSLLGHRSPYNKGISALSDSRKLKEVYQLQARAEQLLAHAIDDPRERWNVFDEARRLFCDISRCLDSYGWLPAGTETPVFSLACEACRGQSWRGGSSLHRLRSTALMHSVFCFLATPRADLDAYNLAALTAERAAEYTLLRGRLLQRALLAKAWHLSSLAAYDAEEQGREHNLRLLLKSFADRNATCESNVPGQLAAAEQQARDLQQILARRAAVGAEAGRVFRALRLPQLAAECFTTAAVVCESALAGIMMVNSRLTQKSHLPLTCDWVCEAKANHLEAAHCWLAVSSERIRSGRPPPVLKRSLSAALRSQHRADSSGLEPPTSPTAERTLSRIASEEDTFQDALHCAELSFARGGEPLSAGLLASRATRWEDALRLLRGPGQCVARRYSAMWLAAATMGETPKSQNGQLHLVEYEHAAGEHFRKPGGPGAKVEVLRRYKHLGVYLRIRPGPNAKEASIDWCARFRARRLNIPLIEARALSVAACHGGSHKG